MQTPVSIDVPAPVHDPLQPTIFHEPWWLKIATGDRYGVVEVSEHGQVVGRLPYMLHRRFGLKMLESPQLTHFLGPAIVKAPGKTTSGQIHQEEISRQLIRQLPKASRVQVHCHRDLRDVTAFQSEGFIATVQFTREITSQPVDALWASFRKQGRNNITRAERMFTFDANVDPDEFANLYARNIEEKKCDNYLDMGRCKSLLEAAVERGRGAVSGARDADGHLVAAIVCVWDHAATYWLMCTRPSDANRGAISMLVWQAIKRSMEMGLVFDFDGFASEGAVRFSASFSADVVPRYIVTKDTVPLQLLRSVRSLIIKPNYFCV